MDAEQREKFRKQLESYKKELGLKNANQNKTKDLSKLITSTKKEDNQTEVKKESLLDILKKDKTSENDIVKSKIEQIKKESLSNVKLKNKDEVFDLFGREKIDIKKTEISETEKKDIISDNSFKVNNEKLEKKDLLLEKDDLKKAVEKISSNKVVKEIAENKNDIFDFTSNTDKDLKKENLSSLIKSKKNEVIENVNISSSKSQVSSINEIEKEKDIIKENLNTSDISSSEDIVIKAPLVKKTKDIKTVQNTSNSLINEAKKNTEVSIESNNEEEPKKSKKWIFILLFLILLTLLSLYYFIYLPKKEKQIKKDEIEKLEALEVQRKEAREAFVADSIANYETKIAEELLVNTSIKDSIFNISTEYPSGYYAIIGAFSDLKNAKNLLMKNTTNFDSYIFQTDIYRVTLFISNTENDSEVYNILNDIRIHYPDAWVLYNEKL